MLKKIITADRKPAVKKQNDQLVLELAEIREISELMFRTLEKKIAALEDLEASTDKKIEALERLLRRAETLQAHGIGAAGGANSDQEIVALCGKGLPAREIAEVFDIPQGEVDLILDLNLQG